MLVLIGAGFGYKDLTLRGLEEAKKCDRLYIEMYTSVWPGLEDLRNELGEVKVLGRKDLEEKSSRLLKKGSKLGLIIPGDPLVATTHTDLLIQARSKGIDTRVIHAPSIYSAVAETGLFIYKFGKTTTLPFPEKGYKPGSPYKTIKENLDSDAHTLVLLDVKDRAMDPKEGIKYLLDLEKEFGKGIISKDTKIIVTSFFSGKSKIYYRKISELLEMDFKTPAALVIPSSLHRMEKNYLEVFA